MDRLLKCKADTLVQLSSLCGATLKPNKEGKASQLLRNLQFYLGLPSTFNLIAVDIGLKNFSYCKLKKVNIETFDYSRGLDTSFDSWKTINLVETFSRSSPELQRFNCNGLFDTSDSAASKFHIAYMNYKIYQDLFEQEDKVLNICLIEAQRTRSNNNKVTLPSILDNYVFENLFYSNYLTLSLQDSSSSKNIMIPMNSKKMTNFLINRFLHKSHINSKNSKALRQNLMMFYFNNVIRMKGLETPVSKKSLLSYYNSFEDHKITKLDDLFDSFLYNLSFIQYYENNLYLNHYLQNDLDLDELVYLLNGKQLRDLSKVFLENDMQLNEAFDDREIHQRLLPLKNVNREFRPIE